MLLNNYNVLEKRVLCSTKLSWAVQTKSSKCYNFQTFLFACDYPINKLLFRAAISLTPPKETGLNPIAGILHDGQVSVNKKKLFPAMTSPAPPP